MIYILSEISDKFLQDYIYELCMILIKKENKQCYTWVLLTVVLFNQMLFLQAKLLYNYLCHLLSSFTIYVCWYHHRPQIDKHQTRQTLDRQTPDTANPRHNKCQLCLMLIMSGVCRDQHLCRVCLSTIDNQIKSVSWVNSK